jgi:hypothetical protein
MSITKQTKAAIIGSMRRLFAYSKMYKDKLLSQLSKDTGSRGGKMYACEKCGGSFSQKDIEVDHIDPVCEVHTSYESMSLDDIADRIFCCGGNLQVLCTKCHVEKCKDEEKRREEYRRNERLRIAAEYIGNKTKYIRFYGHGCDKIFDNVVDISVNLGGYFVIKYTKVLKTKTKKDVSVIDPLKYSGIEWRPRDTTIV